MGLIQVIEAWKGKPMEELLRDMYIKQNMSIPQIAEELHISVGVVHGYLKRFHICKENNLWNLK